MKKTSFILLMTFLFLLPSITILFAASTSHVGVCKPAKTVIVATNFDCGEDIAGNIFGTITLTEHVESGGCKGEHGLCNTTTISLYAKPQTTIPCEDTWNGSGHSYPYYISPVLHNGVASCY